MPYDRGAEAANRVRRFCASWQQGDVDMIVGNLAANVEWENVPLGVVRGRAATRDRIAAAFARVRAIRWGLVSLAIADDGAVLTERIDVIDTGRGEVRLRIMGVFHAASEGIVLWRDYFDVSSYLADLERGASAMAT